ncbi:NADH dehydrogenase-like protein yjlD [Serratia entomophila]|jgi:NADH dehydrogenase|uniref:NAD(P)/FAD-dependent oxidoreductase n=1 Tax=Serratia entomophila TaxID=42906 RepID=UPI001F253CC1|nr:FAD-dependent oxidoreductase [Serratia entomophila]UIW17257.1 FAD-dependent oxidoreductase [Serratia entomophila]CAI0829966.1 NADH dehydrogenase-like protein yjlD [Serratia entomophila]CAI0976942.1 NADH dehydrogenase-like protein yjlD [Serratia entomophila]CAI1062758.1 NADH dehydrogenase-like protein yjlD [Serratia entomophila]CAI1064071.1 NADH dehydrogenase-like protein yjlD [Serratia entomophila]
MTQKIVIAGSGFAGFWAAVSAMRAISLAGKTGEIEVIMVSPTPNVTIRPRLYEAVLDNMNPDISSQLAAVGVQHLAGLVERIDTEKSTLTVAQAGGKSVTLAYDRFVLATGSQLFVPAVPGFAEYGFNVDTLESAQRLDAHLKALADKPHSAARNTAVVVGGGLTGLESATEMPDRLRAALGAEADVRVVIVDTAAEVGAGMGAEPAVVIRQALEECGVESRAGLRVAAIDADGVTLSNGERIAANTVILAAGMRANPLTAQIPGERDGSGRIIGDAFLRAPAVTGVFVTGDTVKAATDDAGNHNVMSCQHAMSLGRVAGHNAAAELVGLPVHPYSQPKYVTCLDLGPWGALYTEGWQRQVRFTRQEGKKIKQEINTQWIYPPAADRDALFAIANPDFVIVP